MPDAIELCKVLLVTDCSELRRALGFTLESQAEQVLAARNVREGKEMIAQHCDIDLVIADLLLPDGDGFALLRCVSLLEEPKPRVILIGELAHLVFELELPQCIQGSGFPTFGCGGFRLPDALALHHRCEDHGREQKQALQPPPATGAAVVGSPVRRIERTTALRAAKAIEAVQNIAALSAVHHGP